MHASRWASVYICIHVYSYKYIHYTKHSGYGIGGKLLKWIAAFLERRRQRVIVNGSKSSWTRVTSGIPQGSVLGPLLFVCYVNDMPENITSTAYMFADDTNVCRFCFFRVSSYQIRSLTQSFGAMLWSMAHLRRCQLLMGGLGSGQQLMMWSAVCSGSPHSHAALSASPHFFMDALYRPIPVSSRFRVVHCFRLRSSPLTPSPGSDT